jgi:cell division protein FtsL
VITFALIGIVTLQLLVLQLNASIGRSLVREAQLQRENAALSIESSELAGGERVETQAAHLGMQLVAPGALRFLTGNPRAYIAHAAAALKAPTHPAASSAEAGASTTAAGTGTAAPVSATPTEPSPSGEASAAGATQSASSTGESASSSTGAGAPSSEVPSPSASGTSPAASSTGAATSSEASAGAAVAQAGGVGSGQPTGGG